MGKTVRYIIHYAALPLDQPSVNELEDKPDCVLLEYTGEVWGVGERLQG